MKGVLYYHIALAVAFGLLSCQHRQDSHNELTVWSSNNPEEIAFVRKYVGKWNEAGYQGRTVRFQPVPEGQSSEEVILAAVVGRTTPDIYMNMWQGDVEDFARSKVLIALDTLDGFLDFIYDRCDSLVVAEITSHDGHIYQVPWKVNPVMLMYNPDLFNAAGIAEIPETYGEFLTAGRQIQPIGVWLGISEVNAIWWQRFFNFLPLYYAASGGAPLVKDGKAIFNNTHGIEVFAFLQTLYSHGYFPKEQMKGQTDPFLAGRVASTFTGPWTIHYNERFKPDGFRYGFHTVPVPEKTTSPVYTYGDPKNMVIFNTCRDPQSAWQFMRTMLTDTAEHDFLTLSGQFPRRKDLDTHSMFIDFFEKHPELQVFARQALYARGMDSEPYMKEVLDLISQEYEACVVYGIKTPESAVADAARAVELLYLRK